MKPLAPYPEYNQQILTHTSIKLKHRKFDEFSFSTKNDYDTCESVLSNETFRRSLEKNKALLIRNIDIKDDNFRSLDILYTGDTTQALHQDDLEDKSIVILYFPFIRKDETNTYIPKRYSLTAIAYKKLAIPKMLSLISFENDKKIETVQKLMRKSRYQIKFLMETANSATHTQPTDTDYLNFANHLLESKDHFYMAHLYLHNKDYLKRKSQEAYHSAYQQMQSEGYLYLVEYTPGTCLFLVDNEMIHARVSPKPFIDDPMREQESSHKVLRRSIENYHTIFE